MVYFMIVFSAFGSLELFVCFYNQISVNSNKYIYVLQENTTVVSTSNVLLLFIYLF